MAFLKRCARTGCAVAAVLAMAACEFIRSPTAIRFTEDRVMLQSVLLAGDTTARALIRLIRAEFDPFDPFGGAEWLPIDDATVRLVIAGDTIAMTPRLDAPANPCMTGPLEDTAPAGALLPGCYVGRVPGGLVSGAVYDLIIDLPGRGRVEGRTTIPDTPVITVPVAGTRIETAANLQSPTFVVAWTGSTPGRNAELGVDSQDEHCRADIGGASGFSFGWLPVTGGTSADVRVYLQCTAPTASDVQADIVLTMFDSVFTRYHQAIRDHHHTSDAIAGFTGPAIGVFGSGASARQPVRFVPN